MGTAWAAGFSARHSGLADQQIVEPSPAIQPEARKVHGIIIDAADNVSFALSQIIARMHQGVGFTAK